MPRSRCRYSSMCLLLLVLASSVLGAQQLPPGMKLAKIEVQGSSLFTPYEIGKMSGLRTGQDIDLAVMAKAASTLAGWGYFSAVNFSYNYTGTNLTVNFQIEASSCSSGATVLLRFNTGSVYSWGSAVWDGNQKETPARLEELSGMKRGEIANIAKIESGLSAVASSYMSNGFLDFLMTPRPEQDDQRREVNYRIQLKEGEQYKMGEFTCALPPGSGCDSIKSQWKIKSGDVMNGAYFDQFQTGPFAEWKQRAPQSGGTLSLVVQKNSATKTANVVVFVPPVRR